tara:strand:- start:71 stop:424 length:354 start_codon:yes stop_codon:yes gene_type:complete
MIKVVASLVIALPLLVACASESSEPTTTSTSETNSGAHSEMSFAAHHSIEKMGNAFFEMMDADGNGVVTQAERAKAPHRKWMVDFSQVDLNGDAQLTRAEYLEALRKTHQSHSGRNA